VRKRLSENEVTPGPATPLGLYSSEDHGHHLQKEKAVAYRINIRPMAKLINAPTYEEEVPH
jgi:hypothetical protein